MKNFEKFKSLNADTRKLITRMCESEETTLILEAGNKTNNINAFFAECERMEKAGGDTSRIRTLFDEVKNDMYALKVINNKMEVLRAMIETLK